MREKHGVCDEYGDAATASLLENWIDEAECRTWFLFETMQAAVWSGGATAEEIGGPSLRVQLVTRHAGRLARLPRPALHEVYTATMHALARLDRPQFLSHLTDLGPILSALGGPGAVLSAIHAMDEVAANWP